jgi:hypothetical protein
LPAQRGEVKNKKARISACFRVEDRQICGLRCPAVNQATLPADWRLCIYDFVFSLLLFLLFLMTAKPVPTPFLIIFQRDI